MSRPLVIHCEGPLEWERQHEIAHGGVALLFARLEDIRLELERYQAYLDPVEIARAERFRLPHDRERFILGHGFMRETLGDRLGQAPGSIRFARGPFGKPHIEDAGLRFNFSDTKDAVLIGITHGDELGVDLETMTRAVDHEAVSGHYFTPEEDTDIRSAADGKRRFLELWTRKEAVLKASGVGIMDDLRALRVDGAMNMATISHEAFLQYAAEAYHVRTWRIGEDHIASLAMPKPLPAVQRIGT